MVPADYISRNMEEVPDPVEDKMFAFLAWPDDAKVLPSLDEIIQKQNINIPNKQMKGGFANIEGIIYYKLKIYVAEEQQNQIIYACHSLFPFAYLGQRKTIKRICRTFNWPNISKSVADYIQSCLVCQRTRSGINIMKQIQRYHPMNSPFYAVYMDFWECVYKKKSYKLLTLIDQFTKRVFCTRLPRYNAQNVAASLLYDWIFSYGVPRLLVSDNDTRFCNEMIAILTKRLGIKHLTSAPYHPEGNAPIESFHKTLNRGFRNFSTTMNLSFDEILKLIILAYRVTPHSTTGVSPFYLVYGIDPKLVQDIDWRFEVNEKWGERFKFLSMI